ncbi:MAG: hypothetical protein ACTSYT_03145 [Candidatus Asgardarchaeia archaeon]
MYIMLFVVDLFKETLRGLWFYSSILFFLSSLLNIYIYIRGVRRSERRGLYIPFIVIGIALMFFSLSTLISSLHAGSILEYDYVKNIVYAILSVSATLYSISALTIIGYREYYGIPLFALFIFIILDFLPGVLGAFYASVIISFLGLSILLLPFFLFIYIFYHTGRFAPLSYAITVAAMSIMMVNLMIPINETLLSLIVVLSSSFAFVGSLFGREKYGISHLTYSLAMIGGVLAISLTNSSFYLMSPYELLRVSGDFLMSISILIPAGYVAQRYIVQKVPAFFYTSLGLYMVSLSSFLNGVYTLRSYGLFLILPVNWIAAAIDISYLLSWFFIAGSSTSLVGLPAVSNILLVYTSIISGMVLYMRLYGLVQPWFFSLKTYSFLSMYIVALLLFLYMLVGFFRSGASVNVKIRVATLLFGTLFLGLSSFIRLISPFFYALFGILSVIVYMVGLTGITARFFSE